MFILQWYNNALEISGVNVYIAVELEKDFLIMESIKSTVWGFLPLVRALFNLPAFQSIVHSGV